MKEKKAKTFSRFIKDFDIFGHPVELNFDRKGTTHQTCCGAWSSMACVLVVALTLLVQLGMLLTMRQVETSVHSEKLDASELGHMSGVQNVLLSFQFVDPASMAPMQFSSEFSRYVSVEVSDGLGNALSKESCSPLLKGDGSATSAGVGEVCANATGVAPSALALTVSGCTADCVGNADDINSFLSNKVLVTRVRTLKLDPANFGDMPFYEEATVTSMVRLDTGTSHFSRAQLRLNRVSSSTGLLGDGAEHSFFDLDHSTSFTVDTPSMNSIFFKQQFSLAPSALQHSRKSDSLWNFLGLAGGFSYCLYVLVGWCVRPFASYSYHLRQAKRLYWGQASDERLFVEKRNDRLRYKRDFATEEEGPLDPPDSQQRPRNQNQGGHPYRGGHGNEPDEDEYEGGGRNGQQPGYFAQRGRAPATPVGKQRHGEGRRVEEQEGHEEDQARMASARRHRQQAHDY